MAPKIEAKMLQALGVRPSERVLEAGTGSGYITACLARLARHVVSVDNEAEFTAAARERLHALAIENGPVDGNEQSTQGADAELQSEIFRDHRTVGGRLFFVVGSPPAMRALLVTRVAGDRFRQESLFETDLAPLAEARLPDRFVF